MLDVLVEEGGKTLQIF